MSDGFMTAVAAVANTLFLLGSLYLYLWLARQIAARRPVEPAEETTRTFGLPDAILAVGLAALFTANAATSAQNGKVVLRTNDLIANAWGCVSRGYQTRGGSWQYQIDLSPATSPASALAG